MLTVTVPLTVAPPAGLVIDAVSAGGGATVTDTAAVAVRPAPSVTLRFSEWAPLATALVSQPYVAVAPALTLWVESVVALSSWRTNWVGEPWALPAAMLTVTVPLTVARLAGLVIDAVSAGGGATVTDTAAVAVRPAPSVTLRFSVWPPVATALVSQA